MLQATSNERPPAGTQRIRRWRDLPDKRNPALYTVRSESGEERRIVVSGNARRLLEGLRKAPVFAASPCRLSDTLLTLRRQHRINVETKLFSNDRPTDRERYGVYVLVDAVSLASAEVRND